jgi:two-component system, chemotaxis family, protein-glutamate methylesterase/glutaminase
MKGHPDIVAIGASSGGIEALQSLLEGLSDLDAIVLVVLHRPANRASYLRDILVRKCHMPVVVARHGERLHHGVCYIGDRSQHLMVGPGLRADLLPDHRYTTRNIDQLFISCGAFGSARRQNARARSHQESRGNCHGPEFGRGGVSGNASQCDQI